MKQREVLQTVSEWETCKNTIPEQGLLIFKFSPRCPISRGVERDFDDWWKQLEDGTALKCIKVNVIGARELSQHLARELHVQHESPQAIWLTSALKVQWHASHRSVTSSALNTQLDTYQG